MLLAVSQNWFVGPLYYGLGLIVAIFGLRFIFNTWKAWLSHKQKIGADTPWPMKEIVNTIITIVVYIVATTAGWQFIQESTTSVNTYESSAEIAEQKMVEESTPPSKEEIDETRSEQKYRADTRQHEKALGSFSKRMAEEAAKIKERSLSDSNTQNQ